MREVFGAQPWRAAAADVVNADNRGCTLRLTTVAARMVLLFGTIPGHRRGEPLLSLFYFCCPIATMERREASVLPTVGKRMAPR
jgi:hypothetical protein